MSNYMRAEISIVEEGVRLEIVGFSGKPMSVVLPLSLEELKQAIQEVEAERSGRII